MKEKHEKLIIDFKENVKTKATEKKTEHENALKSLEETKNKIISQKEAQIAELIEKIKKHNEIYRNEIEKTKSAIRKSENQMPNLINQTTPYSHE